MGKSFFILFLVLAASARAQGSAPANPLSHAEIREEKRAEQLRVREIRNGTLRDHHILIGVSPFISVEEPGHGYAYTKMVSDGFGVSLGYRRHLLEKMGIKGEARFQLGETHLSLERDSLGNDPSGIDAPISYFGGSQGATVLVDAVASLVFGPIGRMTLDPGIDFTWGRHTTGSVLATGDAGDIRVPVERSFTALSESFTGNLLVGARNDFVLSVGETLGFKLGSPDDIIFQIRLGLAYGFRIPKA